VGRIVKARGLKGELKIIPDATPSLDMLERKSFYIAHTAGSLVSHRVVKARWQREALILTLEGVENRDQANRWVGASLYVPRRTLPPLTGDSYYHVDLIGIQVWDEDQRYLGVLDSIMETGANDVWIVMDGTKEYLIPATRQIVKEVNLEEGYVFTVSLESI